jgi:hypothetical protein
MNQQESGHGPRTYPHGSGDRNTMDSSSVEGSSTGTGGQQKKPAVAPPSPPRQGDQQPAPE